MINTVRCVTLALLWGTVGNAWAADAKHQTIVHAGTLLAVPGEPIRTRVSIVIENDRIVEVVDGFIGQTRRDGAPPAADRPTIIDLADLFVLPGLMDMHVHLTGELSPQSRTEALFVTTSDRALRGAHFAAKTLRAGFTTVRDLGAEPEAIYALRDAVNAGLVPGPRIYAAGSSLAATGGHGDVDGYKSELLDLWTPDTICDGADDCRRATRYAIKHGADWIKITATGGVLSDTATGTGQQMTDAELQAIVATAHNLGVKVAAHAHGADGINAALRAGVDSIDHGTFLDDESIRLFKKTGAYLVPTLSPGVKIPPTMKDNPFFTDAIRAKADAAGAAAMTNIARAFRAGIKVAFGTDSAVTPHGENADEFAMMVDAGLTPAQAIYSATVAAADLLGVSDDLGTIEAGKLADLIAVHGNPLEDVAALTKVEVVVRNGRRQ